MANRYFEVFSDENLGKVETTIQNGIPLFKLNDVCDCLGIKNSWDVAKKLKEMGEKKTMKTHPLVRIEGVVKTGLRSDGTSYEQYGEVNFITEVGLYLTILRSDKPEAQDFTIWIAQEVLPRLRERSVYIMGEEDMTPEESEDVHRRVDPAVEKAVKENKLSSFFNRSFVAKDGLVFRNRKDCVEYNHSLD